MSSSLSRLPLPCYSLTPSAPSPPPSCRPATISNCCMLWTWSPERPKYRRRNCSGHSLFLAPSLEPGVACIMAGCTGVSFDSVQPSIAGLDVQTSAGEHRGSMDGCPQGELPQEFPVRTVQRIEPSILGPKVDSWANDHW